MDSTFLPLLHLPMEVQRILANSEQTQRREVLASSTMTDVSVLDQLINDNSRTIQHIALRLHSNPNTLQDRFLKGSDCCKVAVARNEQTPHDVLGIAANSDLPQIRLAALVNPSTPVEEKVKLDSAEAHNLTNIGSFLGAKVVRSHELLLQNRHLLDEINSFTPMLRRAAFGLWDLSKDQFETLRKAGRSKFAASHPLNHNEMGASAMTFEALIDLSNPAADLYLVEHPELELKHAQSILSREGVDPEPHVLGRILRRFGYQVIPDSKSGRLFSGTRINSGSWSDPLVAHYNMVMKAQTSSSIRSLEEVVSELGNDINAWINYLKLESGWEGSPRELAKASKIL